jgi:GR25 family glycosyltransferase involved in LPS biosynthesis
MRKQFDDMKLPFSVDFFYGFTPETSKEYLLTKEANAQEPNGLICCFRSFAALFETYKSKSYDYLITLEDDIALSKNFVTEVNKIIELWKNDFEYVSLGYLLSFNYEELKNSQQNISLYYNNLPSIWGTQAMMFKPETVQKLAKNLHFQTMKEARCSLEAYSKNNKLHRNRTLNVSADAVIPTICKQGIVYPPLAIEHQKFLSTWDNGLNSERKNPPHPSINMNNYYQ